MVLSPSHAAPRAAALGGLVLFLLSLSALPAPSLSDKATCSVPGDVSDAELDPALREFEFDIGYGPEAFEAYFQPDVSTFYGEDSGSRGPAKTPEFNGLAGKFINMSPQSVLLFWDPKDESPGSFIASCGPFTACGSATYPTSQFYFTPHKKRGERLVTWEVEAGRSVYFYDPFEVPGNSEQTRKNLSKLTHNEWLRYEQYARTRKFMEVYRRETGREYLAIYARNKPRHFMWRADQFGDEHWVTTRETHFLQPPPEEELGKIKAFGRYSILLEEEPRLLQHYRDPKQGTQLNMTLKVLSCAPRVFEIKNFLSAVEVDHVLKIATGQDSWTEARILRNAWFSRKESPIIDTIYRRVADLLRIDEALLRERDPGELPEIDNSLSSVAEGLQLVYYSAGQELSAHHDFSYRLNSQDHPLQPERFATLLLYLNQGMEGGETSFPRWVNTETSEPLVVTPEVGKAVLFYSQLPDGNLDDLSQHASVPVREGEKWLVNFWVRDPVYGSGHLE